MTAALAVAVCALAMSLVLVVAPLRPSVLVSLSVIFVVLSSTYLDKSSEGSSLTSVAARVAALIVIWRLSWRGRTVEVGPPQSLARRSLGTFAFSLLACMLLYLVFATIWHGQIRDFVLYLTGCGLALAYAILLLKYVAPEDLMRGVGNGLALVVAVSLVMLVLVPDDALLGERLQGLASNPNSLGFYCAILIAILLFGARSQLFICATGLASLYALTLTASRASLILVVLLLAGWLALRRTAAGRLLAALALLGAWLIYSVFPSLLVSDNSEILRTENSRELSWEYTQSVLRDRPFTGIGFGHEVVEVASSPLRALVHGGYWGGLAVLAMYVVIVFYSWGAGGRTVAFGVAVMVHSFFEGWLLSPVGPMFLLFIVAWHAIAKTDVKAAGQLADPDPTLATKE